MGEKHQNIRAFAVFSPENAVRARSGTLSTIFIYVKDHTFHARNTNKICTKSTTKFTAQQYVNAGHSSNTCAILYTFGCGDPTMSLRWRW